MKHFVLLFSLVCYVSDAQPEVTPMVDFGSVHVEAGVIDAAPVLSMARTGDFDFDGLADDTARAVKFGTVWAPTTKYAWLEPFNKSGRNLRYGKLIANLDSETDPVDAFKFDRVVSYTQPSTVQISNNNAATSTENMSMASAFYFEKDDFLNGLATVEEIAAQDIDRIRVDFSMGRGVPEGRILLRDGGNWFVSKDMLIGSAADGTLSVVPGSSIFYSFDPVSNLIFDHDNPGAEVDGALLGNITAIGLHMQHREFDGTSPWLQYQFFQGIRADYAPSWDVTQRVAEVHQASNNLQLANLQTAVSKETVWPGPGIPAWGDVIWALALLYLDERLPDANQRLRDLAAAGTPFEYFGSTDYIRILAFFNSHSQHFPGRLEPATEAVMKNELLEWAFTWEEYWEPRRSEVPEPEGSVWHVYASENHDLVRKGGNYIIFSILAEDPFYRDMRSESGRSVAEYAELYGIYFKKWFRARAESGLWMELGANYAKYSYAVLLNIHDLAPDPEVRQLAKMFLDVSLIDEAQNSFRNGSRGGGQVRIPLGPYENALGMLAHKELLFGEGGRASHSKVYETSSYQVPDAAVYLRHFGDHVPPYVVRNRILAETYKEAEYMPGDTSSAGPTIFMAEDSAFFNYAYKTPHYTLGSRLELIDGANDGVGDDSVNTQQDRWGWLLFNDDALSRIMPLAENTDGGSSRAFYAYWQVQHENLMIAQRTERAKYMNRVLVYLTPDLIREEAQGWIFGGTDDAWAAVKVTGGYSWGSADNTQWPGKTFAIPNQLYAPIVFLAGSEYEGFTSYEQFREYVLNDVTVLEQSDQVVVQRPEQPAVTFYRDYRKPLINDGDPDSPYNAQPAMRTSYTYNSPYMRTGADRSKIRIRWSDKHWLYDFDQAEIHSFNDGDPLRVLTSNPSDAGRGLDTRSDLTATFNHAVRRGTGTISIRNATDLSLEESFDVATSGKLTFNGSILTIHPPHVLDVNTTYRIRISPSAVLDGEGNPFQGASWTFTTRNVSVGEAVEKASLAAATTHTISGVNVESDSPRKLVLAASWENASSDISATWKGSETFQVAVNSARGRNSAILFLDNPSSGQGDVVVTFGDPTGARLSVAEFYGLAPGVDMTAKGAGQSGNLTTNAPETLVVGCYTANGTNPPPITCPFRALLHSGDSGSSVGNAGFQIESQPVQKSYTWAVGAPMTGDSYALASFPPASLPPELFYYQWAADYPDIGAESGFDADPDGDGLANGLEAWFGSRPDTFSQGLTMSTLSENIATFVHPINPKIPGEIGGFYEWSPDLVNWYLGDGLSGPPVGPRVSIATETADGMVSITATIHGEPAESLFFRGLPPSEIEP